MTTLALNDLNLSSDLDSQALAAVSGGANWQLYGASSVSTGGWRSGGLHVTSSRTYIYGWHVMNKKYGHVVRTRRQSQKLYYSKTTHII